MHTLRCFVRCKCWIGGCCELVKVLEINTSWVNSFLEHNVDILFHMWFAQEPNRRKRNYLEGDLTSKDAMNQCAPWQLRLNGKLEWLTSLVALTSPIFHLEVHLVMDITLQQFKSMWKPWQSSQHNWFVKFSYLPLNEFH